MKSFGTWEHRLGHYTKRINSAFIQRLEAMKPSTKDDLNTAWFGEYTETVQHYNHNRYHALNLNNIWRTGTIEVRAPNGTSHAGEIKAHIHLCLAIAAKALIAKSASRKGQREYSTRNAKYDTRVFLRSLGVIGDEFKNTRMLLLKLLPGSTAWKNGQRAA